MAYDDGFGDRWLASWRYKQLLNSMSRPLTLVRLLRPSFHCDPLMSTMGLF